MTVETVIKRFVMQPFSVYKRSVSPYYYVSYKNEETGKQLPAISTREINKTDAYKVAWQWYKEGVPNKGKLKTLSFRDTFRTADFSPSDVEFIIDDLKRRGLIVSAVFPSAPDSVKFSDFLLEFWDYDRSPYIKKKLRKQDAIHKSYPMNMLANVKKYWLPFFSNTLLGNLKTEDLENFIDTIPESLAVNTKNTIIKAGTTPLRWAYKKRLIETDIFRGIELFSGKGRDRNILTPELASSLFVQDWYDLRAMVANMTAMVTGLRAGELLGLHYEDINDDSLVIRYSWSPVDKLKTTKNNEPRVVEVPFPYVIDSLRYLAESNPHGVSKDSFVFWASKSSKKPMEQKIFLKGLRSALMNSGLSEDQANEYDFHSWRHFFTTYMRNKIDDKLLQTQTGHKSLPMLDRYSNHRRTGDREKIIEAQKEMFSALLPV